MIVNCSDLAHVPLHGGLHHACRASTDQLRLVFNKYASEEVGGERFLTLNDFVVRFLKLGDAQSCQNTIALIGGLVDTTKDGRISFAEFQAFEGLLAQPDSLYAAAFQLFDTKGEGLVSFEGFKSVFGSTELAKDVSFDFDSPFIKLYFGAKKTKLVNYAEFSQFLNDLHVECGLGAFRKFDPEGRGVIAARDFYTIVRKLRGDQVGDLVEATFGTFNVSFATFAAFESLLDKLALLSELLLKLDKKKNKPELTREEFSFACEGHVTPLETLLLFKLAAVERNEDGKVGFDDVYRIHNKINKLAPISKRNSFEKGGNNFATERSAWLALAESVYRFSLGAVAGAVGATSVYPIDLVKTRMQNQRTGSLVGELMYRSSWDCCKKVVRHEGVGGLYRGLLPQLLGVAPEKAIKLTVNDFVRDKLRCKRDGMVPLWGEVAAGGLAGASQVVFTNPLEIVKIRLQVAGEIASATKTSAFSVVKELGLFGLYKGARACLLRDIPFSAIYFPAYAHCKVQLQDSNGKNSPLSLLAAGAIAGIPAASLVTPADVIKTRLQVVARAGQTSYTSLTDAARKIWREEGGRAFWKGAGARVCRSSPQFGVTLLTYELLQRAFEIDFSNSNQQNTAGNRGELHPGVSAGEHVGGYGSAIGTLAGLSAKFGLPLPPPSSSPVSSSSPPTSTKNPKIIQNIS